MTNVQVLDPAIKKKTPARKKVEVPPPTKKAISIRHNFEGNIIHVIGDKIPVREGSRRAEIFNLFKEGMSLNEFLASARKIRGGPADVQIALDKKFIELT
jgi:hypothetical protein